VLLGPDTPSLCFSRPEETFGHPPSLDVSPIVAWNEAQQNAETRKRKEKRSKKNRVCFASLHREARIFYHAKMIMGQYIRYHDPALRGERRTRGSLFCFTKKLQNEAKQSEKDAKTNSKLAILSETKQNKVRIPKFHLHEPYKTIINHKETCEKFASFAS
jgi:hypothetical protein